MNTDTRPLRILSLLDARVISGPSRGLIQLARNLPPHAHLHLALLAKNLDVVLAPIAAAAGNARLTVHRLVESSAYDPRVILRAKEIATRVGATIIQSHSYKPHVIAYALRAALRIPWIGFHHGWTAENRKVRLFHTLDRLTLPRADRVVAVSSDTERLLLAAGCAPARTVMIANAVDARDFDCSHDRASIRREWQIADDRLVACAVGRLSHEKGQDVLLSAFGRIASRVPTLHLAFAGDGPDHDALLAQTRTLGLESRVHFLGHQRDVARVYAASDLLVLPSRSEGMPNVLLEAMSLGLPVVATSVGGVPEVARDGDNAWVVRSDDPESLANAISAAIESSSERIRRAESARREVNEHRSPARRAERFMALYHDVLQHHERVAQ